MQRYLLVLFIAFSSVSMLAQSIEGEAALNGCQSGNLYESSDQMQRERIAHFLTQFETAIKAGDKSHVAQFAHYPLSVQTPNAQFTVIDSPKEFISKYDQILPTELRVSLTQTESAMREPRRGKRIQRWDWTDMV